MPAPPRTTPARCAAHPSRPAVDACPICGRPRCGADATGDACEVCGGVRVAATRVRAQTPPVRLLLALLAGAVVALLGAFVGAEYVQAGVLAYLVPAVAGVLVGGVTLAAARSDGRGTTGTQLRAASAVLALASAVLAVQLEGSQGLLAGGNLLPYAFAVLGAVLWTRPAGTRRAPGTRRGRGSTGQA